jgi:hypothetical protein
MTTSTPGTEGVELARLQYFKSSFGMVIALTFKGTAVVPTQPGFRISRSGKSISALILDSASYPDPLGERMAGWYPPSDSSEGDERDRPVPEKARVEGRRPSPRPGARPRVPLSGSPTLRANRRRCLEWHTANTAVRAVKSPKSCRALASALRPLFSISERPRWHALWRSASRRWSSFSPR